MVTTTTARPKAKFRSSFGTFFLIIPIGVGNYMDNVDLFTPKNSIWVDGWGTTILADLNVIMLMPDEYTKAAQVAELKALMDGNTVSSVGTFADIDALIEQSFLETQWASKRIEAGSKHWGTASSKAASCTLGLNAGNLFITNNHAALLLGGMGTTFQADLTTLTSDYEESKTNYKNGEVEAHLLTDAKIEACNALYVRYMMMAKVAKNIFRNNKAMKNGFVYGTIKKTINPQYQVLETVKIKKASSKTIHNAVEDSPITNTGTVAVLVCEGAIPCTMTMSAKPEPVDEIKETTTETKETTALKVETKTVTEEAKEEEKSKTEEPKTLSIGTGVLLMPEETMINTFGIVVTFTVLDPLTGGEITIKRTVNDK
jgi:hypothetical protein